MKQIEIGLSDGSTRYYFVSDDDIARCLALPKTADRFEYWRKVTGDKTMMGHAMVWQVR